MADSDDKDKQPRSETTHDADSPVLTREQAEKSLPAVKQELQARTAELAQSAAIMQATLDATDDAILVTDAAGNVTHLNDQFAQMWRLPEEALASKQHGKLGTYISLHFSDPAAFLARIDEIHRSSQESFDELRLTDGRTIERFSKAQLVNEQAIGRVWSYRDITDRRRAEELQLRLAAVVESSDDAIISKTLEGIITTWNPGAERMFGYTAEEAVGKHVTMLFPPDRLAEEQMILERIRRSEPVRHYESVRVRKDGTPLNVSLMVSPIKNGDGQVVGASKIARDITERKLAEQLSSRLAAVVDSSDDAIISKTLNGIITTWNTGAERTFGYTAAEAVGRSILMLIPPERAHEEDEIIARLKRGQRIDHYETRRVRKDGKLIDISLTISPIKDRSGNVVGASKIARDITDKKLAEELRFRLAAVVESSDDAIISKTLEGVITTWNSGAERTFGYTAAEVVGKSITILIPVERLHEEAMILGKLRRGERIQHYETERIRKDGTRIDVSLTVSPIKDAHGNVIGASKIARDITERKRADELLRRSEAELRSVADSIPQLAWAANPDGYITWYNRGWFDYTGMTPEQMEGWGWQSLHDPEVLPSVIDRWKYSIDSGEPFEMEFPLRGANGEFRWFLTRVNPLRNESGRIVRWFGTNTDVSEQRRQEQAIKASEARLRALVEATPECVKIVAPDGSLEFMNQAGLEMVEGDSESAVHGACVYDLIAPEHREVWIANHLRVCQGQRINWEFEVIGLKGTRRWMETHAVPLALSDGRIGQLAVTREITARKHAEQEREQLLKSERAARSEAERASLLKDEFLATLSHELRTPLNAILGWSQILASGNVDAADLKQGLDVIQRNARAQTQLIEDLLDMSRIASGKVRLDVQWTDLASVVDAAVDSVRPSAEAKEIRLRKILDPNAGPVAGDPTRLQQVVWNLLSNAIKFTPKGGKIDILLERVNSHLEITVHDSGVGIKPEFLPIVFERFRQADSSTTRSYGGLGLGLSIVKSLVELHGGTVRAKSGGEGQGATFIVSLPLAPIRSNEKREHPTASKAPAIDRVQLDLSGVKVLVVDDDSDARSLISRLLTQCHAEVSTAASAAEGLDQLKTFKPHVLVSDIGMPHTDGYQFIREVRKLPTEDGGKTPAVALTAFARSEDRTRAMMAGFQVHVAKPIEPQELAATVCSLAGRMGPMT